jgi:CO/xanthine dehydrogenase FAD-binding subunit
MPPIRILAHEQYPERARSFELAGGGILPRSIRPQEILDLLGDTKLDQEVLVEENEELMKQARDSAEMLFKPLLETNPSVRDVYIIEFRW